jgi:hypothetical protein
MEKNYLLFYCDFCVLRSLSFRNQNRLNYHNKWWINWNFDSNYYSDMHSHQMHIFRSKMWKY